MTNKLSLKTQTSRSTGWNEHKYNALNIICESGLEISVQATDWGKSQHLPEYKFEFEVNGETFRFNTPDELYNQLKK